MFRRWTIGVVSAALLLTGALRANEKPSDAYQQAMKVNGATLQALQSGRKDD